VLLGAIGRSPLIEHLGLHNAGITVGKAGALSGSAAIAGYGVGSEPVPHILVDEYQNTNVPGVYALGDVCGIVELTPMAIAAGRRLSDRIFGGQPLAKTDYTNVPTVVFSHPVIGTIGLTEQQAREKYPSEELKIYTSDFVNLYYGTFFGGNAGDKPITKYKVICQGPSEKVVGLHLIGEGWLFVFTCALSLVCLGSINVLFSSC
jgi:glutathione reductase (NADPH)